MALQLAAARAAATALQAAARRQSCVAHYQKHRAAATAVQAVARAKPCRRQLAESRQAATSVQAAARRRACGNRYRLQRKAAVLIAAVAHGMASRRHVASYRRAATFAARLMQATQRRRLRRKREAVLKLQAAARRQLKYLEEFRDVIEAKRAERRRVQNERAVDNLLLNIALTPHPPQHKKPATRRSPPRRAAAPTAGKRATASVRPRAAAGSADTSGRPDGTVSAEALSKPSIASGSKPPSPETTAHRSPAHKDEVKADAVLGLAASSRREVPVHRKGTLTRAAAPPARLLFAGEKTAGPSMGAAVTPRQQMETAAASKDYTEAAELQGPSPSPSADPSPATLSAPTVAAAESAPAPTTDRKPRFSWEKTEDKVLSKISSPRPYIRTRDPSSGMDTFVARRPGAAELLRLPALPKPAIQQSLLRPLRSRAAFADTAGHF